MMFIPLAEVCPELAEKETMGIQVLPSSGSIVPEGSYALTELFCSERGCDCRRVMFSVTEIATGEMVALIHWGWDKWSFYRKWLKFGDDGDVDELKGPSLDWNSPETEVADEFLIIIRDDLVKKKDFEDTIKRHYKAFRKVIDEESVVSLDNKEPPVRRSKANEASS